MSRQKTLNDTDKETIDKNFLCEEPTELPSGEKVVIAQEIPKYQKVIFHNMRDPGIPLHFHYASKTHPLMHYDLYHGHTHLLPEEVIEHLEGERPSDPFACHSRLYGRRMKPDGVSECFVNGYKPYFQLKRVKA